MPELHTRLPSLPFSYQEWKQQTSRSMLLRSPELQALDMRVESYLRTPTGDSLIRLKRAFSNWRVAHGKDDEWQNSKRNSGTYAFSLLYGILYQDGDTDAIFGVPSFMGADLVHSRLGVLYLFGKLDIDPSVFSIITSGVLDLLGAGLDYGSSVGNASAQQAIGYVKDGLSNGGSDAIKGAAAKIDARRAPARPKPAAAGATVGRNGDSGERTRSVDSTALLNMRAQPLAGEKRKLSDKIFEYFKWAWEHAVDLWDEHGGEALRELCDYLTGRFLSDLSDTIGGSIGVAMNLYKLIESSFERFRTWAASRHTTVLGGTPASIVDGIRRAMDLGIGQNLYGVVKSGAQLGMQIGSVGASTIVNLVCSIVEVLVKTAWRLFETHRLKAFLADARTKWEQRETLQLHTRPIEFNRWFRRYAVGTPVISAMALNSGLINKMHFLQMFPASQQPVTQSQYDLGVKYLDDLRAWSARYMREAAYSIYSRDEVANALAQPAEGPPDSALRKHLLKPFASFLEGGD